MSQQSNSGAMPPIAIIGMAVRFPGARTPEDFWRNLRDGVESISTFTERDLDSANVEMSASQGSRYVRRRAILDDIEMFDASFFGYTRREAELTDPQQRLFLQCAHEALESAGYDPARFEGPIGVFGGAGFSHYLFANLLSNRELTEDIGLLQISIRNRADHLATNVAYKLNLKGPAVTVQTACSTSMTAVHLACQSLLGFECDMALAGGVSIALPQKSGYLYQEGGILSPDGHCRAFDARAQGTVNGNGAGIVLLKRLEDALQDRDTVEAVILGSAMNNDGSLKVGYTAPSAEGQAEVIAEAQMVSGAEADTISYIETHGTGTSMGDPIEMSALTQVFRQCGATTQGTCAIGSVKTNIGHLDTAAGIAGLVKTVLSLRHRMLPPSLHFEKPNPEIDFAGSPFFVNAQLREWKAQSPRRAGVSSFGIGGTNVHAIVEEAPPVESGGETRPWQLMLLSAKTGTALETSALRLAEYLDRHPDIHPADVAYTLQVGRGEFSRRRAIVCRDRTDAAQMLRTPDPTRVFTGSPTAENPSVVFMFPGQGSQYINMARGLYESEPVFRDIVERCAKLLRAYVGFELRDVLYPPEEHPESADALKQTRIVQPALFVIEYALARLWMEWGIQPKAMIGHSLGDFVAATLAGVLSLEDALALVAIRGRLMQGLLPGKMLMVPLPENEVASLLKSGLALAAVNGPASCVVSGPAEPVEKIQVDLAARGVVCRDLSVSHAFHSPMMDQILEDFAQSCSRVAFRAPRIPFISNLSGAWITDEEATSPEYWGKQLRETVRFGDGIGNFAGDPGWILLEVGPGRTLSGFARQNPKRATGQVVLNSLRHAKDPADDESFLLGALGKLWLAGVRVDWKGFYRHEQRKRVSLPVSPLEPRRCWIEAREDTKAGGVSESRKRTNVAEWFHIPSWKRVPLTRRVPEAPARPWLIFCDRFDIGSQLAGRLRSRGFEVFTVREGSGFSREGQSFTIRPRAGEDYEALLGSLHEKGGFPEKIVHLWNLVDPQHPESGEDDFDLSFWSPVFLARAAGALTGVPQMEVLLISNHLYDVTGDPILEPQRATLLGPCRVVPQEYPGVACRHIDLDLAPGLPSGDRLSRMITESLSGAPEKIVAWRKDHRWVQTFEPLTMPPAPKAGGLRQRGTYLITGGLGGVGLVIAEQLAESVQARLVLTGRSDFPAREAWGEWLRSHEETDLVSAKIRKLLALEGLGAEILVISADVSDQVRMRNVIEQSRERFGEIHGVVHAAGAPGGGMIQLKTQEMAAGVMAPKVRGTMVLAAELRDTPLDFFVVCSSRASILGGFGQADYCAAGAFLDVYAHQSHRAAGNRITSVNWDAWRDVGMLAAKASEHGMGAGATATQTGHPLLGMATMDSQGQRIFITTISPATHWIVDEHRISGLAVMPGAAYLEMARAAAQRQSDGVIEIRDAFFVAPLYFRHDESREVKIILGKRGEDYTFRALSRPSENASDRDWREHATATVRRMPRMPQPRHDLAAIMQRCNRNLVAAADSGWTGEGMGPRWRVCTHVSLGQRELLATLELPEQFASELDRLQLYPTLLDRAIATAKRFLVEEGSYLPLGYGRVRIHRPLERKIHAHIRLRNSEESGRQTIVFDMVLMNARGEELAEVGEMSEKRIEDPAASARAFLSRQDHEPVGKSSLAGVYAASLRHAILPKEGGEAFRYILGLLDMPQVIVSTRDFMVSMAEAEAHHPLAAIVRQAPSSSESKSMHARPAMPTDYAAAGNALEEKITGVWQRVLGIDRVGVHDNYFDLGGDSVQAIQIIAQLNQQGFHLTPQKLFQHQTVAELAAITQSPASLEESARIENETGHSPSSGNGPSDFALAGLDEAGLRELAGILEEADMESGQATAPVTAGRKNSA